MSAERYTFDTNIFFYSLDDHARDKHLLARKLIAEADPARCIVLSQTLGELCNSAAKKRRDLLPVLERTVSAVGRLFQTVTISVDDVLEALAVYQRHGIQFWDAALWATARRAGCRLILTEDFQDGRTLEGVLFRDPFTLSQEEIALLLS